MLLHSGVELGPEGQMLPHAPQFCGVVMGVWQPVPPEPEQFAKPAAQALVPQTPAVQVGVPLAEVQTLPQVPQLSGFVAVAIPQPLAGLLSQFE